MNQEREVKAIEQEKFYADKTPLLMLLTLLLIIFAVSLMGVIILLRSAAFPAPVYFPMTDEKELIAEEPLDQASIETNQLLNWVAEGMRNSNTFNFMNYSTVLDNSSIYYTKEGYESYKNVLTTNNIINKVIEKKFVLKATPTDAPQILLEKPLAGRYMWKIKLPMEFRYQSVNADLRDLVQITLIVMRVPTTQSPNGVLILKYDLEFGSPIGPQNQ